MSPISSRKRVPPSASSKRPRRRAKAPVNAPFSCPKSSEQEQRLDQRRAVDGDERARGAVARAVESLGDELLARAALAADEDRAARAGDLPDGREEPADRRDRRRRSRAVSTRQGGPLGPSAALSSSAGSWRVLDRLGELRLELRQMRDVRLARGRPRGGRSGSARRPCRAAAPPARACARAASVSPPRDAARPGARASRAGGLLFAGRPSQGERLLGRLDAARSRTRARRCACRSAISACAMSFVASSRARDEHLARAREVAVLERDARARRGAPRRGSRVSLADFERSRLRSRAARRSCGRASARSRAATTSKCEARPAVIPAPRIRLPNESACSA